MPTVLVVDDDPATLTMVSGQLKQQGHEVMAADNPEQAITLVERSKTRGKHPEVAVLDISMPEMTGFELAQILHMREETARLPVIFLSSTLETPARFTDDDGVTALYVTKSSPPETLTEAVAELTGLEGNEDA